MTTAVAKTAKVVVSRRIASQFSVFARVFDKGGWKESVEYHVGAGWFCFGAMMVLGEPSKR